MSNPQSEIHNPQSFDAVQIQAWRSYSRRRTERVPEAIPTEGEVGSGK